LKKNYQYTLGSIILIYIRAYVFVISVFEMYVPFLLWQSEHFNYLTIILCLYTHTYKQEWNNINRPRTEFYFAQAYLEITYRIFKIRSYISILFSYLKIAKKRRELIPFKDVNIDTKSKLTIEAYSKISNEPDCIKDELHTWDDSTRKSRPQFTFESEVCTFTNVWNP